MDKQSFYHALLFRDDMCIGCTHCMKICPTEAIRIKNGKAVLAENRCVDCGECYRVCPVCAITIEQDDFDKVFNYKVRVALVPAVFIGQFPEEITTEQIYSELLELGFTHVYEVEHGVEALLPEMEKYIIGYHRQKPVFSSFCPAIVRLIQVKFPAFTEQLMHLKAPVDVAALYNRRKFFDMGFKAEEIGLFYITPCAAKIVAVRSPVGEEYSEIDGVINMNFLYNKVLTGIKKGGKDSCLVPFRQSVKHNCIIWSLTRGESVNFSGRTLAIDGIHNVIEFLEKLENEDESDIDFLELRACDESCAGGVLATGNRFLTVERLHNRSNKAREKELKKPVFQNPVLQYQEYLTQKLAVDKIRPRSMMKLDDDMIEAMKKVKKVHDLMIFLPQVDCGSCGCPTCSSLAEDVAQGKSTISKCIFVQQTLEDRSIFTHDEVVRTLKEVWGSDKFNRKWQMDL